MRINNSGPQPAGTTFNTFFNPLPPELTKLCVMREPATSSTYVALPEAESSILSYTRSGIPDVGIISGSRGIGKTSVLLHHVQETWKSEECAVLYKDLADSAAAGNLGTDYYQAGIVERQHRCVNVAMQIINGIALKYVDEVFPIDVGIPPQKCADFLRLIVPSLAPIEARFSNVQAEDVLKHAVRQNADLFHSFLLYFAVREQKRIHVKIVLDNLDDKDSQLVLALAEQLAHLRKFFDECSKNELRSDKSVSPRVLSTLIACRPATYSQLKQFRTKAFLGLDWFGLHEINIRSACHLGRMLNRRYDANIAGKELYPRDTQKLTVFFGAHGKELVIQNRDELFRRICTEFERTNQARMVLELCNNDVADAMAATFDILRNRHFVATDDLFKLTHVGDSEREKLGNRIFTPTTVLRCLAYGNQDTDSPVYPICDTRIPDLLNSQVALVNHRVSLVKARIVSWFDRRISRSVNQGASLAVGEIQAACHEVFALRPEIVGNIIDELHGEKLVEHGHGSELPSSCGASCLLSLTTRGACLWRQLEHNSILLQCHREVANLDLDFEFKGKKHKWCFEPAYSSAMKDIVADLPWICAQFWAFEKSQFQEMSSTVLSKFNDMFGEDFVTERIVRGLIHSLDRFWDNEVKDTSATSRAREMCVEIMNDCSDARAARQKISL